MRGSSGLIKASSEKHVSRPTILARWHAQEKYRKSLAKHDIDEKEVMLFDRIALERHDFSELRELNGYRTPHIGFFL